MLLADLNVSPADAMIRFLCNLINVCFSDVNGCNSDIITACLVDGIARKQAEIPN